MNINTKKYFKRNFKNKIYVCIILLLVLSIYNNIKANKVILKIENFIKYNKNLNISKKNFEKNLHKIKYYVMLLKNNLFKIEKHANILKPKISFIASVYNKEKYLYCFLSSIQKQLLREIEIILVDDCSIDKSIEIINKFYENDKRIKLIRNKKNMGSLYARYIGAIKAKGEYIIFVDSDDIVLKYGLINSYNYLKHNNLDMIQFHTIFQRKNYIYINRRHYKYLSIISQPILTNIYYYRKNRGIEGNTALWDKLVKREILLKSLKFIGENYLKKKIVIENDVIILFALFRISKNFQYIDELGYFYFCSNKNSITKSKNEPKKANEIIYSIFTNLKFLYEHTDNNNFDKIFIVFKLNQAYKKYRKSFYYLDKGFILIEKVLNKLIYSKFISVKDKKKIISIKKEIVKKKLKKKKYSNYISS